MDGRNRGGATLREATQERGAPEGSGGTARAASRRDRRHRRSRVRRVILLCILLAVLAAVLLTPSGSIDPRAAAPATDDLPVLASLRTACGS